MQDEMILDLYFSRNEKAIEQTKIAYGGRLNTFAYSILKNMQDSEESVSDTYLKAWNNIPPTRPQYFYAYLCKICRFICFSKLDYKKATKRNAELIELSDELLSCVPSKENIESVIDEKHLLKVLQRFLDELTQDNRVVFLRRYWYGQSVCEISKMLKFSQSKVKTSLFRSREKLKKMLESEGISL